MSGTDTVVTAGMIVAGLALATVAGIVVAYVLAYAWAWATMRPVSEFWRNPHQMTQEQESERAKEIAAYGSQWSGITTQSETAWESDYSNEAFAAFHEAMKQAPKQAS